MAYTVAQAEVSVTPDAKNFGNTLRAQIAKDADKIGKEIGDKLSKGINDRLKNGDTKVGLGVDTAPALREVERFNEQTRRSVVSSASRTGKEAGAKLGDGMAEGMSGRGKLIVGAVGAAIMAGGPLLAVAGGVLFGGLAAVAVHSSAEIKDSAHDVAKSWTGMVQATAAQTIPTLTRALDTVTLAAGEMSVQFGRAFQAIGPAVQGVTDGILALVRNALPGLVSMLQSSAPIFAGLASLLGSIGAGLGSVFDSIGKHAGASGTVLTSLGNALESVLDALGTLVGVGAEVGSVILPPLAAALGAVAKVLEFIAPVLPSVVLGFAALKIAGAIAPLLASFAVSLEGVATKAFVATGTLTGSAAAGVAAGTGFEVAAAGARGLEAAMGPIGWVVAGISVALPFLMDGMGGVSEQEQNAAAATEALTAALRESKGAITDNVRATAAMSAQSEGLLDMADEWGVSTSTIVDAALGQQTAMDQVTAGAANYAASLRAAGEDAGRSGIEAAYGLDLSADAANAMAGASDLLLGQLTGLTGTTEEQIAAQEQLNGAMMTGDDAAADNAVRLQGLTDAASAAASQISTLKSALDALTGQTVSMNEAEIAVDTAMRNAIESTKDLTGRYVDANGVLDIHTEKGAAVYQSLTDIAGADNTLIATMEQHGATAEQVMVRDGQLRESFINTAMSMGVSSGEAHRLADEIYGIPDQRNVEITADTLAATQEAQAFKAKWDAINSKTITITAQIQQRGATAADIQNTVAGIQHLGGAIGGIVHPYAAGGFEPMAGGVAQVVGPNTWRVIGDRAQDDEAYIPINDSARSLSILAQTANRMGWGLSPKGMERGGGGGNDSRSYQFNISAPSDPQAIAREIREAQRDLEFLHG